MRDEIEYFCEVRLLEQVPVALSAAGLSDDASRRRLRNEFFNEDGTLVARVATTARWLDLAARKLTLPPEQLTQALQQPERTQDFEELPSSVS